MKRLKIKIPKKFQSYLWSVDVKNLDLEKDKDYIIHQILSYGDLEAIKWLFKVYGKKTIKEVFLKHPYKVYSDAHLCFVKNLLLGLKNIPVKKNQYVTSIF